MRRIKRSAFIKSTYNFDIAHCTYNITWMKLLKIYLPVPLSLQENEQLWAFGACTPKKVIFRKQGENALTN